MQSIFNASFGIYFPKFTGTIYELLSAPISSFEAVLAYVGAAVTKSVILALVTLVTAILFVPRPHRSPARDDPVPASGSAPASACSASRSASGRKNFEQLQIIPMLIITPLTFLGGAFYSVNTLQRAVPDDHPVQPDRPPDQRLPLELLLDRRRAGLVERAGHPGDHRRLHGGDRLDVPDRLPPQAVSSGDLASDPSWSARSTPCPSRFWATKSQLTMFDSTASARSAAARCDSRCNKRAPTHRA